MAVPVRQLPLMGEERRALHEKHRERCHADVGHDVLAVLPTPLVRQTRTGLPQPRYEVLERAHTELESDSPGPANRRALSTTAMVVAVVARIGQPPIHVRGALTLFGLPQCHTERSCLLIGVPWLGVTKHRRVMATKKAATRDQVYAFAKGGN
jgi:hypothetical protein